MNKSGTKQRLTLMLERDKEEINEPTRLAAKREFERVAQEFFETEGDIRFSVAMQKGGYTVTVNFDARRIKNFSVLK